MFLLRRPSPPRIERFLSTSKGLPLSYRPVGLAQTRSRGFDHDETVVTIGHGPADFEHARAALAAWSQFAVGWVELFPRAPSVEAGAVAAVLIRHMGLWSLNGARVVYGIGDRHAGIRFGYAYGTLTSHAEAGEELFDVSMDPASLDVTYRIVAASRPSVALARIGYPLVRLLQARFRRDSAEAMRHAVRALRSGL